MDTGDVRAKFEAFGWDAVEIDGHDMGADRRGARAQPHARPPGGDRLPDEEGHAASPRWRAASASTASRPSPEQAGEALEELEARLERADEGAAGRGAEMRPMEAKTEPIATRHAYGDALVELGEAHEDVVALDADLAVSTQSMKFGKRFPDRFFNVGAAEANMMSMACGLAATGKVPYCLDLRDLRHRPRLRPGPPGDRPQRAQGADRRARTAASRWARTAPRTR